MWCWIVEISGVSLPNEEALHDLIDVPSLFWYFGPGCRLLTPCQTGTQTFRCGAVDLQSTDYLAFTTCARALCSAVTVSWLGVCLYVQIESSYVQLDEIPALVLVTILCLGSLSPQLCVYSCSWPWCVNHVTRTVYEKRNPPKRKGSSLQDTPRSCCPDAPARGRIAAGQQNHLASHGKASATSAVKLVHCIFI